jgi:isoquinoline 1-oxidoreductase alpha subunit
MAAAALLDENPQPTDGEVAEWMTNLCRCATYARIKKAIRRCSSSLPRPPDAEAAPAPSAIPGSTP